MQTFLCIDIHHISLNSGAWDSGSNGLICPTLVGSMRLFSLSHPFCLFSNLVFPNHGQGSESVCCACIFALLPTLHHCPLMFFPSLSFFLFLSPSLVGLGKRAASLYTSGQDWWLVNSISQHCRPHWCRTKSIRPSKKSNMCMRSILAKAHVTTDEFL